MKLFLLSFLAFNLNMVCPETDYQGLIDDSNVNFHEQLISYVTFDDSDELFSGCFAFFFAK